METRENILNELREISPVIARINKVNVFTVPAGYFDSICETVSACLREEGQIVSVFQDASALPSGYFEKLVGSILNRIKAQQTAADEIKAVSPLLHAVRNKNVFKVPQGYFEQLNQAIVDRINNLSAKEELQLLSPLLYDVQHKNVFEVPADYFNNLTGAIKGGHPEKAKLVNMRSRFIKYAAAAAMVGAIAFGLYKYTDKPSNFSKDSRVASIDASIQKGRKMNDKQFEEALKNLSAADVTSYLADHGDITDLATLGNTIDETLLPSQEDYLLDDKTLDNYLDRIETTTLNN